MDWESSFPVAAPDPARRTWAGEGGSTARRLPQRRFSGIRDGRNSASSLNTSALREPSSKKKLRGLAVRGLKFRGAVNRLTDTLIGSATADVAAHKVINFGVSGAGFFG